MKTPTIFVSASTDRNSISMRLENAPEIDVVFLAEQGIIERRVKENGTLEIVFVSDPEQWSKQGGVSG